MITTPQFENRLLKKKNDSLKVLLYRAIRREPSVQFILSENQGIVPKYTGFAEKTFSFPYQFTLN